jgi:uncharacterized Rossmann fold enzyme
MKQNVQLRKEDYEQICSLLNIDPKTDLEATKVLHSSLSYQSVRKTFRKIKSVIKNKNILIFAPGPSLESSLKQLLVFLKKFRNEIVIFAVDGAAKALLEFDITIDAIITDLDGSIAAIRESLMNGSIIVVHAHGDNIAKITEISDIIPNEGILGTTQTKETSKVKNLGGFTDGDRAAYLAANLRAKKLVLIGYDFGEVIGKFSKPDSNNEDFQASERKLVKFTFAKKLLSQLPNLFPSIKFYNLSNLGEEIENISKIPIEEIGEYLKE